MVKLILFKTQKLQEEFTGTEEEFINITDFFCKVWRKDGLRHREDGPAVIRSGGYCEYWLDGKLHRDGGPAVFGSIYGTEEWYKNGEVTLEKNHQRDSEFIYKNGVLHNDSGPSRFFNFELTAFKELSLEMGKTRKHGRYLYSWHIEGEEVNHFDDWFPMLSILGGSRGRNNCFCGNHGRLLSYSLEQKKNFLQ